MSAYTREDIVWYLCFTWTDPISFLRVMGLGGWLWSRASQASNQPCLHPLMKRKHNSNKWINTAEKRRYENICQRVGVFVELSNMGGGWVSVRLIALFRLDFHYYFVLSFLFSFFFSLAKILLKWKQSKHNPQMCTGIFYDDVLRALSAYGSTLSGEWEAGGRFKRNLDCQQSTADY